MPLLTVPYEAPDAFSETSPGEMQAIIQKYRDWRLARSFPLDSH